MESTNQTEREQSAPKARILVVDDDSAIRNAMCKTLAHDGYACDVFGSVKEAIRFLETHPVDLVITDILMPEHDGFELLMYLRKNLKPIPKVIAMSGGGRGLDVPFLMRSASGLAPVCATLEKPFTTEKFRTMVCEICEAL